jgi:hypothetical protein
MNPLQADYRLWKTLTFSGEGGSKNCRRDGREVEGGGLENRCPVMSGTGGSNPSPSAMGSDQLSAISRQLLIEQDLLSYIS